MIGRREFLEKLASLPAAQELAFRTVSVLGNRYRNSRIGLELERPAGWEFSSIADFVALRERQVLEEPEDIYDGPHPLKDPQNVPVFLFECPEFRNGHFVPCATLYDEELLESVPEDQQFAHAAMLFGFAEAYRNVNVDVDPEMIQLKGAEGTISRWSYEHVRDTGEVIPLLVQSILVFREPRAHTYHLVDSLRKPHIDKPSGRRSSARCAIL